MIVENGDPNMTEQEDKSTVEESDSQKPLGKTLNQIIDTVRYLTQIHTLLQFVTDEKDVEKHYLLLVKPELENLSKHLENTIKTLK